MPSQNQDDIQQLNLNIEDLRGQLEMLQRQVAAIAQHVGWVAPDAPPLPEQVTVLIEQGDRNGAVLALAELRAVDNYAAELELRSHGL